MPRARTRRAAAAIGPRAGAVAIAAAGLLLIAAKPALSGTYRAAVCNADLGAWHADARYERSSRHYSGSAACGVGGAGLSVRHRAPSTRSGAWGAWAVRAPDGTTITRLAVSAAGRGDGGHVPELGSAPAGASLTAFATPAAELQRFQWSGVAETFAARLRCRRASGCAAGRAALIRVKRIAATLADHAAPSLAVGGSLLAPGSRRGLQTLVPRSQDAGSGVRRLLVQVNGQPTTGHTLPCQLADGVAIRLRPCPAAAEATFGAATASLPFRQGSNRVRVCAADYAPTTAANRTCTDRDVRVDNLCPVSTVRGGAKLRARLRRSRRGWIVAGRLLAGDGRGVAGAHVCVAARVSTKDTERIVATPTTGAEGTFQARLLPGPSRKVRLAYWPDETEAVERYLHLRVAGHPRLRLRPDHPIRNGDRIRFEVRIPGPDNARRRVRIQVHSDGRWLELRTGLTGALGAYRARYRFHATTKRRRYAFRALVPKQRGYPYEAGRSRIRRQVVIGR